MHTRYCLDLLLALDAGVQILTWRHIKLQQLYCRQTGVEETVIHETVKEDTVYLVRNSPGVPIGSTRLTRTSQKRDCVADSRVGHPRTS
jgi:hypothetical protein